MSRLFQYPKLAEPTAPNSTTGVEQQPDKWWVQPSEPRPVRRSVLHALAAFFFGPPVPKAVTDTEQLVSQWWQQASQPRITRALQTAATTCVIAFVPITFPTERSITGVSNILTPLPSVENVRPVTRPYRNYGPTLFEPVYPYVRTTQDITGKSNIAPIPAYVENVNPTLRKPRNYGAIFVVPVLPIGTNSRSITGVSNILTPIPDVENVRPTLRQYRNYGPVFVEPVLPSQTNSQSITGVASVLVPQPFVADYSPKLKVRQRQQPHWLTEPVLPIVTTAQTITGKSNIAPIPTFVSAARPMLRKPRFQYQSLAEPLTLATTTTRNQLGIADIKRTTSQDVTGVTNIVPQAVTTSQATITGISKIADPPGSHAIKTFVGRVQV